MYFEALSKIILTLGVSTAFAATPSAKATPTPLEATPTATISITPKIEDVKNNIEERIRTIVTNNLSTAEAKIKQEVNIKKLVGKVGQISSIQTNSFNLESKSQVFQIATNEQTIITKNSSPIKLNSLAIGDKVIVIASKTSKALFTAKKIIVITNPSTNRAELLVGKVSKIDTKKRIATIIDTNKKPIEITFSKKFPLELSTILPNNNVFLILSKVAGEVVATKGKIMP